MERRISLSRERFLSLDARGHDGRAATHAPLSLTLPADTETPVALYHRLSGQRSGSFLLETAEHGGGELVRGRYSFVGFDARRVLSADDGGRDVLDAVEDELSRTVVATDPDVELPPLIGGAVGYVGYDAVRHFERVPLAAERTLGLPEAQLVVTDEIAALDHLRSRLHLIVLAPLAGDRARSYDRALRRLAELESRLEASAPAPRRHAFANAPLPATSTRFDRAAFEAAVREAQRAIEAGEIFQVVLSQRHTVERAVDPFALYRALRALNPSPYMFLLRFPTHAVVGASPETLVKTTRARPGAPLEIRVRPIAGTRPRGRDAAEDETRASELASDPKELAEHRMLLDLGRNDVGRVARLGSVTVERERVIERYSHVMHLVSEVRGELAQGRTALDAFRAAFPAGTVSGAPKIRAMEHIAALEPERRGIYAGAVGYFGFDGQSDTCIAIRTVIVEKDRAHVQAGAGIVLDSIPSLEHDECLAKARGPLAAIAEALAEPPEAPSPQPSPAGGRAGSARATDGVGGAS